MGLLTKDQILSADDLKTKDVVVPQWGGTVRLRTMTASERDRFENMVFVGKDKNERMADIRATLLSLCIVDEKNNLVFSEKDIKALGGKSAAAVDLLFSEAQKLNAVTDQDIEDAVKNSEATQGESDGGE